MRRWGAVLALVGIAVFITPAARSATAKQFVLSPENNHLWAYDADTGARQLVSRAVNGPDPQTAAPNGLRRDINGQICVAPDGRHVITGEDTVVGGSSHDPRIAGWGYFDIVGAALGDITMTQTGKLAPAAGRGPGYTGDPDNYGCGFLDANRLFTSAIGDTLPGQPANGQLFLWFAPFTDSVVAHCQIDATLATAGGIAVAPNGDVLVTANRPDGRGNPSAVWRYQGRWPATATECTPEYVAANIERTQVIPSIVGLPVDLRAPTPSFVAISPRGTLVVASVFTGTVSEFNANGSWRRDLYPLSPITVITGPLGDTPYGLTFTADGSLWIADLGIVGAMPAPGAGSLLRLRFDANGKPRLPAERIAANLTFPDGLGVYTGVPRSAAVGPDVAAGTLPASGADQRTTLALGVILLVAAASAARPARTTSANN